MNDRAVYLIRHGEIEIGTPGTFIGKTDLLLTDRGRSQMNHLAGFLADKNITRLICSPLTRCRESAEIVGRRLGLTAEIENAFQEISLGSWEGLTVEQVRQKYPGQYEARGVDMVHFRPRNGESFQDLVDRVWPAFTSLELSSDKKVAVIAHSGVNRVILCKLLGMELSRLFLLEQSYGGCNIIVDKNGAYILRALNYKPQ